MERLYQIENINFLLALSAPTKCGNNILTGDKCKNNEFNTELESPILAGFRNMRKIIYSEPNKNIYQIFGHQPVGFASTIMIGAAYGIRRMLSDNIGLDFNGGLRIPFHNNNLENGPRLAINNATPQFFPYWHMALGLSFLY